MTTIANAGGQKPNSIVLGGWNKIEIVRSLATVRFGTIKEGVMTLDGELYEHWDNDWPPKRDNVLFVSTSMKFSCVLDEITRDNIKVLLDLTPTSDIIYIGDKTTPTTFTLQIERYRQFDSGAGNIIKAFFYKAVMTSPFELGSVDANGNISMKFECTALKDSTNSNRLGYIQVGDDPV